MVDLASEVRTPEQPPTVRRLATQAVLRAAGEGVTERGPIGEAKGPFSSMAEWQKVFGGYTLTSLDSVASVQAFFDNGGSQLWWTRIVHVSSVGDPTTKTSALGTLTLLTALAAATAGAVTSSLTQPYNLEPGDTLDVKMDGGSTQTITVAATAPARVSSAETFALSNGQTLIFTSVNGAGPWTKTFATGEFVSIGAATAEEVVASLNAFFASNGIGAVATLTGGGTTVTITSTRRGTGANINISASSTATALTFTTGNLAGTGNVSNVDAVTAAEIVAMFAALPLTGGTASVVAGAVKLTSGTTGGSSSAQVLSSSTADDELGFSNAIFTGYAGTAVNTLRIDAKYDGTYAESVRVVIAAASSGDADEFDLNVEFKGVIVERWPNLSMDDSELRYVETIINHEDVGSIYIQAVDLDATPVDVPATGTFGALVGGDDGLTSLTDTDYTGGETVNGTTGFRCFDGIDLDVLFVPGRATSAVHNAMITYCEITRAGLMFAVLDPPANNTAAQIVTYVTATAGLLNASEYAAIYWPRYKVANPDKTLFGTDAAITIPCSGGVVGVYAKNDARKVGGAFEQPAGIEFGKIANAIGLEMEEVKKKHKRELVFPKLINPISKEGGPIFIDGARTLKEIGNFPSVGQRRGVIFVEQTLIPGLAFMRHRNIKPKLYEEGERSVLLFLIDLTRADCFKSTNPNKAFFIDFGEALNPPSVQATKKVFARLGLATSEPAEFVIILVGPDTRALDEELAALAA